MIMAREAIRNFHGVTLGYVETSYNGDKTVTDFGGTILGYYRKDQNITTNFYGQIRVRGDAAVAFIFKKDL